MKNVHQIGLVSIKNVRIPASDHVDLMHNVMFKITNQFVLVLMVSKVIHMAVAIQNKVGLEIIYHYYYFQLSYSHYFVSII